MKDRPVAGSLTLIVAGVSGSGKTTVGELLAAWLGWRFEDGDSLHPASNIAKMASGQPLTDEDRAPWLRRVGEWIDAQEASGQPAIVACSALKRRYRSRLLDDRPEVLMVFLEVGYEVVARRLAARRGHFFNPELLSSQFADLEQPAPDEARVLRVPELDQPEDTADEIIRRLGVLARLPSSWPPPGVP
jgi:gluconokinase